MHPFPFRIVLASGSPRRHEILDIAGIPHTVRTSHADESRIAYVPGEPERYVMALAELKGNAVPPAADEAVLSADTVVYEPGTRAIFGKPKDHADAVRMLSALSGSTHQVITGVSLAMGGAWRKTYSVVTEVTFYPLETAEIEEYIRDYPPYDKAGAYGIQEQAALFVREIRGDYLNIVGLPVSTVYRVLREAEEQFEKKQA